MEELFFLSRGRWDWHRSYVTITCRIRSFHSLSQQLPLLFGLQEAGRVCLRF
jgi:hypothetical protein